MYTSRVSLAPRETGRMVRPMSRKDIFYSGSVTNLREYQSQKSLTNYRNSVISLTKYEKDARDARDAVSEIEKGERKFDGDVLQPLQFISSIISRFLLIEQLSLQNMISVHALCYLNRSNRP